MTGLNDNHKRRILTSLQYADKLLQENLYALAPGARPLFSGYVQDLSPAQSRLVASYTGKIREQMVRLLEKCGVETPAAATFASGKLRTGLTSVDLTLEDIYPEKMRGYGKMDTAAARDLFWTLQQTRRLVSLLLALLSASRESQAGGLALLEPRPELSALLNRMAQMIVDQGLVEFLPALDAIIRCARSHRFRVAVFGKLNSGKSSLINRLLATELLPVGVISVSAFPVHVVAGSEPRLRVSFLDRVEECPLEQLADYSTEQKNPANSKRVVALEARVDSPRLNRGIAFIDAPDITGLTRGTKSADAYLPEADLGLLLVDGHSTPGRDDLDLLQALEHAGIPAAVLVTKCDLLGPDDIGRVTERVRGAVAGHLGSAPEVVPMSSKGSWARAADEWFERTIPPLLQRSRELLIDAVDRQTQLLRAALLATLELKADRAHGPEGLAHAAERILRHMDESLAAFEQHWEHELDSITAWTEEILGHAALTLAHKCAENNAPASLPSAAVIPAVASCSHLLLQKYHELAGRIRAGIDELKASDPACGVIVQELPRLQALPMPLASPLSGVTILPPPVRVQISQAARTKHYRQELQDKMGAGLLQILGELKPRLKLWLTTTMNTLRENVHVQTDHLRYRSSFRESAGPDDRLLADITFLRAPGKAPEIGEE